MAKLLFKKLAAVVSAASMLAVSGAEITGSPSIDQFFRNGYFIRRNRPAALAANRCRITHGFSMLQISTRQPCAGISRFR